MQLDAKMESLLKIDGRIGSIGSRNSLLQVCGISLFGHPSDFEQSCSKIEQSENVNWSKTVRNSGIDAIPAFGILFAYIIYSI